MAHTLTDTGLILITTISDIDEYELDMLKSLNKPNRTLVVNVGEDRFASDKIDLSMPANTDPQNASQQIIQLLIKAVVLDPEYFI